MFTPYVGTVYKYLFLPPLDTFDGIYKTLRVMTYDEMLADNINIADIWVSAGSTEVELETEINEIKTNRIIKIQDVDDENKILHIPFTKLAYEPDYNIKQYHRLFVVLDLGTYAEMSEVEFIKNIINETAEKTLGVTQQANVFSHSFKWMTENDYNTIVTERNQHKSEVINFFSENNRLRSEVLRLRNLVEKYENTITNIANGVTSPPSP